MTSDSPASPAREALARAVAHTGLQPEPKEETEVLRRIARALEPGAREVPVEVYRAALCQVRRKKWISRLLDRTRRSGRIWITREEIEEAVGGITDPAADDQALEHALAPVSLARLRGYGASPHAAFAAIQADLVDIGRVPSPAQTDLLLMAVAIAFDLPEGDPFLETARKEEAQRQRAASRIEQTAQNKRAQEEEHLKAWESSLVPFNEVPRLLHCSHREALRWIARIGYPLRVRCRNPVGGSGGSLTPQHLWPCGATCPSGARRNVAPQQVRARANMRRIWGARSPMP